MGDIAYALAAKLTPGGLGIVRHEDIRCQRLVWVDPVGVKIAYPLPGEEGVVDQEVAREAFGRFLEDQIGGVGENLRLARHTHDFVTTEQILDRCGRDSGARP